MRGLIWRVAAVEEEFKAIVDQRKIEEKAISRKTVATMADNLNSSLRVITAQSC